MRIYRFSSPDSSSDNGTATIVVLAANTVHAVAEARKHLRERGREDLVEGLKHRPPSRPAPESGVIYDDIEG